MFGGPVCSSVMYVDKREFLLGVNGTQSTLSVDGSSGYTGASEVIISVLEHFYKSNLLVESRTFSFVIYRFKQGFCFCRLQ